jgi:hypothetical protein
VHGAHPGGQYDRKQAMDGLRRCVEQDVRTHRGGVLAGRVSAREESQ